MATISPNNNLEGMALNRARGRGIRAASKANDATIGNELPRPGTGDSMESLSKSFGGNLSLGGEQALSPKMDSGVASATPASSVSSASGDGSEPAILPGKLPPTRAKPARTIDIVSNMNELVLPTEAYVYRYDVEIQVVHLNGVKDLSKGPPNDYLREERRKNCYKVWQYIVQRESAFFGDPYTLYYDRAATLYSLTKLAFKESSGQQFTVPKQQISESPLIKDVLPKDKGECILIGIKCAEQCNLLLSDFAGCIDPDVNSRDRTLQQFLELATSQKIFETDAYFNFGNKAFLKNEGRLDLGGGKWLCTGFEKNVRFVGDDERSVAAVLQIDSKKTAFFKEILVSDFVSEHLRVRLGELQQRGMRPDEVKSVSHQLRDLVVYTHNGAQFEADALSRERAQDIMWV
uniref:Uncharacterized protein n=1 Tax=Plectus sambesii TaxID=2011161 RepID=A0A914XCR4_9BILA